MRAVRNSNSTEANWCPTSMFSANYLQENQFSIELYMISTKIEADPYFYSISRPWPPIAEGEC